MKKFTVYLVSLLVIMSMILAACKSEETTPTATQAVATQAPVVTEPPATGGIDCMGAQPGDVITMFYQWSGTEEERLNRILQPLVDALFHGQQPQGPLFILNPGEVKAFSVILDENGNSPAFPSR